jgi:hypothetical protein
MSNRSFPSDSCDSSELSIPKDPIKKSSRFEPDSIQYALISGFAGGVAGKHRIISI